MQAFASQFKNDFLMNIVTKTDQTIFCKVFTTGVWEDDWNANVHAPDGSVIAEIAGQAYCPGNGTKLSFTERQFAAIMKMEQAERNAFLKDLYFSTSEVEKEQYLYHLIDGENTLYSQ